MKGCEIAHEAQQALVKLLAKLDLIDEAHTRSQYLNQQCCPIAHFASQGAFDENDAIRIVAEKLHLPVCVLDKAAAASAKTLLEHPKLAMIPLERWLSYRTLPLELEGKTLLVAMANPLDHQARKAWRFDLSLDIKEALARESDILEILTRKANANRSVDLQEFAGETPHIQAASDEAARMESNVSDNDLAAPPVVRLVNKILADAIEADASDIHVTPDKDGLTIKIRIDGILQPLFAVPNKAKNAVLSRLKLLAGMDISEKRKPQDGRLRIDTGFGFKDLRLSTIPTIYGENLVVRILSSDVNRITFDNLGVSEEVQKMLARAQTGSARVLLVTGPTGSGKTSTLYACLLKHRDGTNNIVTIEDPIEYRIQGVNQIQVNPKAGVTFSEGLRSILRQDPDIIMVGEIRDAETCNIALQAAQTGHLVLSTMHTNSAAGTITRLRDLGIPPYLLASSLGSIVAQRLVRKLCPVCCQPDQTSELSRYIALGLKPEQVRRAQGCEECNGIGYRGRTGVFSFLEVGDAVREAIRLEKSEAEIEALARHNGFKSLVDSGIELVNSGVTSIDELERNLGSLDIVIESAPLQRTGLGQSHPQRQATANEMAGLSPRDGAALEHNASGIQKRRILLVEDDENTSVVLKLLLQREMFDVELAQDGLEGLEKVYQNPPHLIVCDFMMPRMNGLEMIQKMRRDNRTRCIPVLMLTAADSEANEVHSIESGADDFVSKTADAKVMIARIHRLLERPKVAL